LSEALPEERDETDLASLPRLVFHFNRRNYGRLRQLVDCINGMRLRAWDLDLRKHGRIGHWKLVIAQDPRPKNYLRIHRRGRRGSQRRTIK